MRLYKEEGLRNTNTSEFNESIAILHKPAQDGFSETAEIQKLGRSVRV